MLAKPLIDAMARGRRNGRSVNAHAPALKLRVLDSSAPDFDSALEALIRFEAAQDPAVDAAVAAIVADVRGAATRRCSSTRRASTACTRRGCRTSRSAAMRCAAHTMRCRSERTALETAAARIRDFHERQKTDGFSFRTPDGTELGQRVTPLDRAGLYVPGGKAAYPSSVLMNAIPAQVAGVGDIVMVVPTPGGVRNPLVLAAAHLAGVSRVFTIGGAQAIAALAYGTETIPAVDKICGPGNAYVAAAKRRVFGAVGIDMVAGASEIARHRRCVGQPGLGRDRPLLAGRARRDGAGDPAHAGRAV